MLSVARTHRESLIIELDGLSKVVLGTGKCEMLRVHGFARGVLGRRFYNVVGSGHEGLPKIIIGEEVSN